MSIIRWNTTSFEVQVLLKCDVFLTMLRFSSRLTVHWMWMSRLLQAASGLVLWFRIFLRLAVGPAVTQGCVFRSGFLEILLQLTETYHVRVLKKSIRFKQIFADRGNCGPVCFLADVDPDPWKEVQNMPTIKIMGQRKPTLLRKVLTQRACSLIVQIRFFIIF